MKKALVLVMVLVGICVLSLGQEVGLHPDQVGPYQVGEESFHLEDTTRGRAFDILVFYPAIESDFPLILFSHGFLISADAYRYYGERLASHGFVVALPRLSMDLLNMNHKELSLDIRCAIDYCIQASDDKQSPLFSLVNKLAIGVAGHSLGGKLSMLATAGDERIRAAALLDPVDSGNPIAPDPERYPSVAPELMPKIHVPLLILGAELGSKVALLNACAPENENYQRFFEAANPPAVEVTQLGVGHAQYAEGIGALAASACASGDVPDAWVHNSTASYITAFFLETLLQSRQAADWLNMRLSMDEELGAVIVRRK